MGLVAFDLQEIIPSFFGDGPGDLALAVQCVGGDHLFIEAAHGVEEFGRCLLLAALGAFLLIVQGHGFGRSITMASQTEDTEVVANHLPVQSQSLRQL